MDADYKRKRREWCIPTTKIVERHDRFSMDPQRFEEILAEITTGYGNIRNGFENVNIAEILEEMVTEFARTALETADAPKFTELAVLLQHCAQLYGKKVDFLYQHVVDVSESLATVPAPDPAQDGQSPGPSIVRRRRRSSAHAGAANATGFTHIRLTPCNNATRAKEALRPPPTLPRMYIELEPRVPAPHERPLQDLAGEPIGLPCDYHVTGRLRDGFLVDELEATRSDTRQPLRPLSLLELQEALAAAAPPDPPLLSSPPHPDCTDSALCSPPSSPPTLPDTPLAPPDTSLAPPDTSLAPPDTPLTPSDTPLPPPDTPLTPPDTPMAPPAPLACRKRRSSTKLADIVESRIKKFRLDAASFLRATRTLLEFALPDKWVSSVVKHRARQLLYVRLNLQQIFSRKFIGFEDMYSEEKGGFPGWSDAEVLEAASVAAGASLRVIELESDDDGFFENSSFSSMDSARYTPPLSQLQLIPPSPPAAPAPTPSPAPATSPAHALTPAPALSPAAALTPAPALSPTHAPTPAPAFAATEAARAANAAWSAQVAARAVAEEARGGMDVRALGSALLATLPCDPAVPLPFKELLRRAAKRPRDVSRLLLTTLLLANSGNVQIAGGAPPSVGEFAVSLLSTDERLFAAAADAEAGLLAPPEPSVRLAT